MKRHPSKERVSRLEKELAADPANLDLAKEYWDALGKWGGCDIRNGGYVVKAFRPAAMRSPEGAVQLAKAYRQLCELSGEAPRQVYVDDKLAAAIHSAKSSTSAPDSDILDWVLEALNRDDVL